MNATKRTAGSASGAGADAAAKTQANAKDRLSRTTTALDAVKAMQLAARKAAEAHPGRIKSSSGGDRLTRVKDGLGKNGLQVDPLVPKNLNKPKAGENGALWIGAKLPTQTNGKGGQKNVTIVQTDQQALLNWETFNVGKKTSLYFDQTAGGSDKGKWVAFNKVNDPKGRPSQILGSIKAEGQVYVINQNGIIFGGTSQVNVHTLVASALPINGNLIASGLLNNPGAQFLFSAVGADAFDLTAAPKILSQIVDARSALKLKYTDAAGVEQSLTPVTDYTVAADAARQSTVTLTSTGAAKLAAAKSGTTLVARYDALQGNVVAEAGSQLTSPTSAAKVGGRIMLVGANVKNAGTISTPDGQTILAAGSQVGMAAHPSADPSLRGVDVFVGQVAGFAGRAVNSGLVDAPRASVVMTGKSVQQNGFIDSTTSVSLNGRIDLLAEYNAVTNTAYDATNPSKGIQFIYQSTGVVTLGEGSVSRILPEWSSDEKVAAQELSDVQRSQIHVKGLAAHFDSDSTVWAPNGKVTVDAGTWFYQAGASAGTAPVSNFVYTAGQIYVDAGAVLDVAGSTAVSVPLDDNILTLQFRGGELADSPLQRDGPLRATDLNDNLSLTIDARLTGTFNGRDWVGTPLGDAAGFLGLIERGIGQLTAKGGSVDFQAGDSVVLQQGSSIDASGGWFNNEGGLVKTTKVVQGSRLIDIADATPDQVYDGVYDPKYTQTHSKWGVTKTYRHALNLDGAHYESDYVQGANGGSISIIAPSMAIAGELAGSTVVGPKQIRQSAISSSLPDAGKLSLTFRSQDPDPLYGEPFSNTSLHAPKVVFGTDVLPKALPFALAADGTPLALADGSSSNIVNPFQLRTRLRDEVVLSPALLTDGGFGDLVVDNGAGDISVPAGVQLNVAAGGSITASGRNIDIQGSVSAPGGSLSFTANNMSPYLAAQLKAEQTAIPSQFAAPDSGRFTLGASASLSTAGLVIDGRRSSGGELPAIVGDGGTIAIVGYDVDLAAGGLVDVSGGGLMTAQGRLTYGDAGAIAIKAGQDPNFSSLLPAFSPTSHYGDFLPGGQLSLGAELRGYSGATGGSLALQAPFIQVGGEASPSQPGTLLVQPEFFNEGGFGSFALTGLGGAIRTVDGARYLPGLVIAADTVLEPSALGLRAEAVSSGHHDLTLRPALLTADQRTPVSLSFASAGVRDAKLDSVLVRGDLVMESGAVIRTDPLASVSFKGDTVSVLGSVFAPGGTISISGGTNSGRLFGYALGSELPTPTVYLGSKSVLSAAGAVVLTPDPYGRRVGSVLPGGNISVAGNIVAARGAVLDVSGATATFDVSPFLLDASTSRVVSARSGLTSPLQALQTVPVRVDSDAGGIVLTGGEELFTDATLLGRAGGPSAQGGTLSVSSGRFYPDGGVPTPRDSTLIVTQGNATIPLAPRSSLFSAGEQTAIGQPLRDANGEILPGLGHFAADTFLEGGFDSLDLGGTVRFKGPIDISARGSITVADKGMLYADDHVNLSAAYIKLGMAFPTPQLPDEVVLPFGGTTTAPFYYGPTFGPGVLTVKADLIDIGNLSLQNIRRANFIAENGDIRGAGTLNIAGHLRLQAGQVYTPTALSFTIVAYDYQGRDYQAGGPLTAGSVTIQSSGTRPLPLSAGGTLSVYATNINQSGVLRAPFGTINLGWDGTGETPVDLLTGNKRAFPITKKLLLGARSVTSVSAIDPTTGEGAIIPYGVSLDGNSWIDPRGVDITSGGLPAKSVHLSASRIVTKSSSQIDLRGGGDLYAYRWVGGLGGSEDILASDASYAVLPDYQAGYAPYAPYNDQAALTTFSQDPADASTRDAGYVNPGLSVGDRIYLGASEGLAAGYYTLLPARYALLPGAFLVTPKSGATIGAIAQPDGTTIVPGYRANDLSHAQAIYSRFEVASAEVVRTRAQYDDFSANEFLRASAIKLNVAVPLLPTDSGYLSFQATDAMRLNGMVQGRSLDGGRGAFVDISSPADIVIVGSESHLSKKETKNALVLNATRLSSWDAESLLIGGLRETTEDGTTIKVSTGNLTVDNSGSPLTGPEIILVANQGLTVAKGAEIEQAGSLTSRADSLVLNGNGTLLRVSSDPSAEFARLAVTSSHLPKMTVGAGASISGASITLDSTYATDLSSRATLRGRAINLSSGQISIALDDAGVLLPTDGLVLAGRALRSLRSARSLSLLSYSSIDVYGTGEFGTAALENLELHAGEIRGFNNRDVALFEAEHVLLDNRANGTAPGAVAASSGALAFKAGTIELGDRHLKVDQFANVRLGASGGVLLNGKGRFFVDGDLLVRTPAFFAAGGATEDIRATGALKILAGSPRASSLLSSGLGASLSLQGASVTANSDILLPSGLLTLHATSGNVNVGGQLDVSGVAQAFNDVVKYTDGGEIHLVSDAGDVNLDRRGALFVDAQKGGGDAGTLSVGAGKGTVNLAGTLSGKGGRDGRDGSFVLDVGALPELTKLNSLLEDASFDELRSFRVRQGDVLVNGTTTVRNFRLSADDGSIFVTGKIDASGATGGTISLAASGSVILDAGSLLDASGRDFSSAGQGGAVTLEAGAQIDGVIDPTALLDLRAGSKIDLSVAGANAASESLGQFTGTLHLRAPQNATSTDLQIAAIDGTIKDASSIVVEGYKIFDLGSAGVITTAIKTAVKNNGIAFVGAAGTASAGYAAMHDRLLANNAGLDSVLTIRPGAELINRAGDITLGSGTYTVKNDWDLHEYRFGPKSAPGVLTLRAAGNLVFNNTLSDGFAIPSTINTTDDVYTAPLMDANSLLPMNAQSWSYRLTAGADFSGADFRALRPLASLGVDSGSLKLGRNNGKNSVGSGSSATTSAAVKNFYQVIRTGSGDIDIAAARDVQLLNQFATIYTAGTKINDPSLGGTFDLPSTENSDASPLRLGAHQQINPYPAQFSLGGGDVRIFAQGNITHLTRLTSSGPLVADSGRELPMNWLYRRGYIDPSTGQFGILPIRIDENSGLIVGGDAASTAWWIDFSNFFEGVGALGGGDVTLVAGGNVSDVDAVVPTNARLPKTAREAGELVELGGGDLVVRAGGDLDAGVYYVERGHGTLSAGGDITTNSTRAPSIAAFRTLAATSTPTEATWLPTTLFLGKGAFEVSARGDVLLGPTANPFLLPEGYNNAIWNKSYFSTYAVDSSVDVSSLGGTVTLRNSIALPGNGEKTPMLWEWIRTQLYYDVGSTASTASSSFYQPWLRLNETSVNAFKSVSGLLPPTLRVTAYSGDLDLVGNLTLSPAAHGNVELVVAGSINGLQPAGGIYVNNVPTTAWGTSTINLSDATPSAIPGVIAPLGYQAVLAAKDRNAAPTVIISGGTFLDFIGDLFDETGALDTVLETKQTLHAAGPLHANDSNPVRLYATGGDISGLTLYAPKAARIVAGQDISDISFYIQNIDSDDISIVAAGRDILPYNASSPLRTLAQAPGNLPPGNTTTNGLQPPLAGDIQLSGPGTLEVLAGHNLDLGTGLANADGTGSGITTVGNARNPYLPFEGANIIAGAGIGPASSLTDSNLDFQGFIDGFLKTEQGESYLTEALGLLDEAGQGSGRTIVDVFDHLSAEQQAGVVLNAFYIALRQAGRGHIATGASYDPGYAAIAALFPAFVAKEGAPTGGDITTRARDIRTKNGGSIDLFVPHGELTLANTVIGNPLVPPGIITESGGDISIFTDGDVDIGIGRVFTLRGGNEIIWSSTGDIAAGAASKTVKSAPPTRVLIDPQSGDVQTDLAGLSTGGGIGVLATVAGVAPGDVDLIAPVGVVDAGDAGIRASGSVNIAATKVLNASNIAAPHTTGIPTSVPVAAPNTASLTNASRTAGAANQAAESVANQARQQTPPEEAPSDISVEVIGYGGGDTASL